MDQSNNGQNVFRCPHCGNAINPNFKYCSACGALVENLFWNNKEINKAEQYDDLPVINTDEIFKDIEHPVKEVKGQGAETTEELPVINMDGLFDDVSFADTASYNSDAMNHNAVNRQYYNMNQPDSAYRNPDAAYKDVAQQNQSAAMWQTKEIPSRQVMENAEKKTQQNAVPLQNNAQSGTRHSMQQPVRRNAPYHNEQAEARKQSAKPQDSAANDTNNGSNAPEEGKKKSKKKPIIITSVIIAILLIIGSLYYFVFGGKTTKADLMDLCTVSMSGVNGNGNIELSFNENCDLYSNFFIADDYNACDALKTITFKVSKDSGLSNGDTVTVYALYDTATLKKYDIKVKNDSMEYTVSGLSDAEDYDLFAGVTVEFEGYDGHGKAIIDTSKIDDFAAQNVTYSIKDDTDILKNGDSVVVVAEVDDQVLEENYYTVVTKEKEYIVEGLLDSKEYDVFQDIALSYTGASPNLSLSIDTSSCDIFVKNNVSFSLDITSGVELGDTVTITAKFDETTASQNGYTISNTTKSVTVNNVPSYANKLSSSQVDKLNNVIAGYLSDEEDSYGDGGIFDMDFGTLVGDGGSYTSTKATSETVLCYFLYNEDKSPINSYIIVEKYTVTLEDDLTGDTTQVELYVESSINNVILDSSDSLTSYDSPSEVVTGDDLNYFIDRVNSSGYTISSY